MIQSFKGIKCPKCKRKGLHYSDHPHAFGWKDYDHVKCRFCHARFKSDDIENLVNDIEEDLG